MNYLRTLITMLALASVSLFASGSSFSKDQKKKVRKALFRLVEDFPRQTPDGGGMQVSVHLVTSFRSQLSLVKEQMPEPEFRDLIGQLLTHAALYGRNMSAGILIDEYHANVNHIWLRHGFYQPAGGTPLLAAIQSGNLPLIKLLVRKGANLNCQINNTTVLIAAVGIGNKTVVEALLSLGADPNLMNVSRSTSPLMQAVWLGMPDRVGLLLRWGADPDVVHLHRTLKTPRLQALHGNNAQVAELLARRSAELRTRHGGPALVSLAAPPIVVPDAAAPESMPMPRPEASLMLPGIHPKYINLRGYINLLKRGLDSPSASEPRPFYRLATLASLLGSSNAAALNEIATIDIINKRSYIQSNRLHVAGRLPNGDISHVHFVMAGRKDPNHVYYPQLMGSLVLFVVTPQEFAAHRLQNLPQGFGAIILESPTDTGINARRFAALTAAAALISNPAFANARVFGFSDDNVSAISEAGWDQLEIDLANPQEPFLAVFDPNYYSFLHRSGQDVDLVNGKFFVLNRILLDLLANENQIFRYFPARDLFFEDVFTLEQMKRRLEVTIRRYQFYIRAQGGRDASLNYFQNSAEAPSAVDGWLESTFADLDDDDRVIHTFFREHLAQKADEMREKVERARASLRNDSLYARSPDSSQVASSSGSDTRDYQEDMISEILEATVETGVSRFISVDMFVNTGKTIVMGELLNRALYSDQPSLSAPWQNNKNMAIVAPTIDLARQTANRLKENYPGLADYIVVIDSEQAKDSRSVGHLLENRHYLEHGHYIFIFVTASFAKYLTGLEERLILDDVLLNHYHWVLIDEVHKVGKSVLETIRNFVRRNFNRYDVESDFFCLGFSATPDKAISYFDHVNPSPYTMEMASQAGVLREYTSALRTLTKMDTKEEQAAEMANVIELTLQEIQSFYNWPNGVVAPRGFAAVPSIAAANQIQEALRRADALHAFAIAVYHSQVSEAERKSLLNEHQNAATPQLLLVVGLMKEGFDGKADFYIDTTSLRTKKGEKLTTAEIQRLGRIRRMHSALSAQPSLFYRFSFGIDDSRSENSSGSSSSNSSSSSSSNPVAHEAASAGKRKRSEEALKRSRKCEALEDEESENTPSAKRYQRDQDDADVTMEDADFQLIVESSLNEPTGMSLDLSLGSPRLRQVVNGKPSASSSSSSSYSGYTSSSSYTGFNSPNNYGPNGKRFK